MNSEETTRVRISRKITEKTSEEMERSIPIKMGSEQSNRRKPCRRRW
jgi:hypothetical protein